jgi:CheY-like chemotaxis protein
MNKLKRIIYIDDELDIRLMAEYALTNVGNYDVLICESGAEALEKIEDFAPDLILIDLMMPELDGIATISEIRKIELFKNTPAIFITAKIVPPEIAELVSHDAAVIALIHKPGPAP